MLPLSLLRIRAFNSTSVSMIILGAALMNVSLLTSFYLTRVMGVPELRAGLVLSMMAIGSIVSSAISGPLSAKYGSSLFAAAGMILIGGATYSMSGLQADSTLGAVMIRLAAAGFGVGLAMAPVMSSAIRVVPEDKVGIASGVTNMAKSLGSVIGVAVIVTVLQHNTTEQLSEAASRGAQGVTEAAVQQQAAADAFSQTYKFAGYLLLPGIAAALYSDERRQRKARSV
jgi:MFS family permease